MPAYAYPHKCWIRLIRAHGGMQPAFAPEQIADPLTAYQAFLYEDQQSGIRDVADEMAVQWHAVADGSRKMEDVVAPDIVVSCVVEEDGSVTTEGYRFARGQIFDLHDVEDVDAPQPT